MILFPKTEQFNFQRVVSLYVVITTNETVSLFYKITALEKKRLSLSAIMLLQNISFRFVDRFRF